MASRPQPILGIDELTLRPWTSDDVPALVAAYDEPAIRRWHTRSMTIAEAAGWVAHAHRGWTTETSASWAVMDQDSLVGRMSLRRVDLEQGVAEVGYWTIAAARGRSIAPRALAAISSWALHDLGLHRLELEHSTQNHASCRVAAKTGYLLEGTKRSGAHDDGWHDMHLHAMLG
jgi:RimJ/RimL family protein N-acetyltransferase